MAGKPAVRKPKRRKPAPETGLTSAKSSRDEPGGVTSEGTPQTIEPASLPADAREWISFDDEEELRTWTFDVTFLLSSWRCLYGSGCQGVLTGPAAELEQGCCSYGAHFTGDEDVERVERAAASLGPDDWQFASRARRGGAIRIESDGTRVTRLVEGACIFLNRPGFPGGAGCALHRGALARGLAPMELKPDVCWQLPLRREDSTDDSGRVTSLVSQWDRSHWGGGGEEFHWWCTEAAEAFTGGDRVYKSLGPELTALVGERTYQRLSEYLEIRASGSQPLPHPALRRPNTP